MKTRPTQFSLIRSKIFSLEYTFYFVYVSAFLVFFLFLNNAEAARGVPKLERIQRCEHLFSDPRKQLALNPYTQVLKYNFPEVEVASAVDSTSATGATLFYFPHGARASFDARGGSVASSETTLLEEAGYSNAIDGIAFGGGSTMGLGVGGGVRNRIFRERSSDAGNFDFIPSVPGAIVYDFGGRLFKKQSQLAYPTEKLGELLYDRKQTGEFVIGKFGAGVSTTVNKSTTPMWGGQGAAVIQTPYGKIMAAVVLNAVGNVFRNPSQMLNQESATPSDVMVEQVNALTPGTPQKNTTLSIIITDIPLNRTQLKRLAMMVHTSMARYIHPFHAYSDGDIMFSVSVNKDPAKASTEVPSELNYEQESRVQIIASELMGQAIMNSVMTANALYPDGSRGAQAQVTSRLKNADPTLKADDSADEQKTFIK